MQDKISNKDLLTGPILVPVDFSAPSRRAFENALIMAEFMKRDLVVAYVVEENNHLFDYSEETPADKFAEQALFTLSSWADSVRARVRVIPKILRGKILQEIDRLSRRLQCPMVWLALNSEDNQLFVGTNVGRIIRGIQIPVVVCRPANFLRPLGKVVIPLDFSEPNDTALKMLSDLFAACKPAMSLHIVMVQNNLNEHEEARANKVLSQFKKRFQEFSSIHSIELISTECDQPGLVEVFLDYCKKMGAGLLAITSQQSSGYSNFYLSPLLQEILIRSDIPVMVFSPDRPANK